MEQKKQKRRSRSAVRKKKVYTLFRNIFVGTLAVILLLNLFLPSRSYSANENRSLAQFPKVSTATLGSGKFFTDFDSYYSDQFAGRDLWMSVKALGTWLLGNRESNNVIFGKDGYLMQYPTEPVTEALNNTVAAINEFTAKHGSLRHTMIVVPDAANVLTSKLPANAPVRNQVADIRNFEGRLDSSISMVDAGNYLKNAAANGQIFYKTDHHWTSYGAYQVFLGAAASLDIGTPVTYAYMSVSDAFQGTLSSRSGRTISRDSVEIYQPQEEIVYKVTYPDSGATSATMFVSSALAEKDHYTVFFGGNHPLVEIKTTVNNQRNLLIFKDSYANSFVQFLLPYYEKIILVDPRYYYDNIEVAMTSYGITDVLYMYSADTLLSDTGLSDTLSSGVTSAESVESVESSDFISVEEETLETENTEAF